MPPNLLVGQGATDFAQEHGMPIARFESLVSPAAQERWRRWSQDLLTAERKEREAEAARYGFSTMTSEAEHDPHHLAATHERRRKNHTSAMAEALVNDAQPVSPPASDDRKVLEHSSSPSRASSAVSIPQAYSTNMTTPDMDECYTDPFGPPGALLRPSTNPFMNSSQSVAETNIFDAGGKLGNGDGGYSISSEDELEVKSDDSIFGGVAVGPDPSSGNLRGWNDGASGYDDVNMPSHFGPSSSAIPHSESAGRPTASFFESDDGVPTPRAGSPDEAAFSDKQSSPPAFDAPDSITDTVGAIAIDTYGNIACGASSGGIGMKHRGRIGPAALVGIGASVIPVDPDDPDRTTVATVTSGTGEHMGTTMAASICSNRVFFSQRRTPGGGTEDATEDEALKAFIERDFMGHPSVRNSQSTGAIGMLTVKRTSEGAWLYFAHNTDSFAIASMSSDDVKPSCSMSRSRGGGTIAQGGKGVRFRRRK